MIEIKKATIEDAQELTRISTETFNDDTKTYFKREEGGPPGYNSLDEQIRLIDSIPYYKILLDGVLVGGIFITPQDESHMELTRIFITPKYQNKGLGKDVIAKLESMYPKIKKWTLDTPSVNVRNHYLYEKIGYKKVNEMMLDPNTNLRLFFYEKEIS